MDSTYTPINNTRTRPLLGVVAGSGQVARSAVEAGADILFGLSAGVYRSLGQGSLPAFLPFGNANTMTLRLLREHILPWAQKLPVVAGAQAGDIRHPLPDLFSTYRDMGVHGVTNWPSVGFLDGTLRAIWERSGRGVASEIALLKSARAAGLATYGFVYTPEEARTFAEAGVETLILNLGLTRQPEDLHATRDMLQINQTALRAMLEGAQSGGHRPRCLAFGGSVTEPDDLEELLRHCPLDGFAGGSVFERLPVGGILDNTMRRFKSALLHPTSERAGESRSGPGMGSMLGFSAPMEKLFHTLRKVAPFDVSVCIEGETGVGKELVAIQLHQFNRRSVHPFVTVNCGAIPDTLLESELFGHEKGSFTGADRRRLGKFELAQHGTLFLDEIADLTPRGQVALLRALQQREIMRVGGERPIPVDVRIVAASNLRLARLVEQGRFRADLYHRLNSVTLWVPPLRDRLDDLPLLIEDVLSRLQAQLGRRIAGVTPRFLARMRRHVWSGNVRELQHVLAQAALLEDGMLLEGHDFEPQAHSGQFHGAQAPGGAVMTPSGSGLHHGETALPKVAGPVYSQVGNGTGEGRRGAAERALAAHRGNKSRAATALGVTRKTFYAWLDAPYEPGDDR